jgi:GDPmannose 4,6-dehydratase
MRNLAQEALTSSITERFMPRAFITGITGQDGSYLAELLLGKGYEVHGLIRRDSPSRSKRIHHLRDNPALMNKRLFLHCGDLCDALALMRLINIIQPDEVYNLGAQSQVRISFDVPDQTCNTAGMGVLRLLEAVMKAKIRPRFYQASSSEMFGKVVESPQSEKTPFHPRSPYGVAKVFGYWMTVNYREGYGLHASNGILFNHESPRRGAAFVTRKITMAVARIKAGLQDRISLGNLEARRDWGYAAEYVEVMWLMLQQDQPDDYVIASGETHTVREFVEIAFDRAGLDWQKYVEIDPNFFRPAEVDLLVGNASKANRVLGWKPRTSFCDLVNMMVDADLAAMGRRRLRAAA